MGVSHHLSITKRGQCGEEALMSGHRSSVTSDGSGRRSAVRPTNVAEGERISSETCHSGRNGAQQSEQDGLFMWPRVLVSSAERMTSKRFGALGEKLPSRRVLAVGMVAALLVFAGCMGGGGSGNGSGTTAAGEGTTAMEGGGAADGTEMMEETTAMEGGEETEMMEETTAMEGGMEETTMMEGTEMMEGTDMGTEMMGNTTTEMAA
jgi:hypothetical protein